MTERGRLRGDGWSAFVRDGQWILKFKNQGSWQQHRIPRHITSEVQVRRYVQVFLKAEAAEHKAQALPTAAVPGSVGAIHAHMSLRDLAQLWTTEELARLFPDHIRRKRSARSDRGRLTKYILPLIGDRPISDFSGSQGLELADSVMRKLPPVEELSRDSRRQVAQILHRLFALAVYPLKLLSSNPLPQGWLPKGSESKAKSYLYPLEDAQLMRCTKVPLLNRLFYGFLDREGLRASEARGLQILDIDFERGACHLDKNKTDDPRTWALSQGARTALRRYLDRYRPDAKSEDLLFSDPSGKRPPGDNLARALRRDLKTAGVKRAQLFANNTERKHIRGHDLRATFVTLNLANGRTETWIGDRTGHKSSQMISRYRRLARTHAELSLGELKQLVEAVPELADDPVAAGKEQARSEPSNRMNGRGKPNGNAVDLGKTNGRTARERHGTDGNEVPESSGRTGEAERQDLGKPDGTDDPSTCAG